MRKCVAAYIGLRAFAFGNFYLVFPISFSLFYSIYLTGNTLFASQPTRDIRMRKIRDSFHISLFRCAIYKNKHYIIYVEHPQAPPSCFICINERTRIFGGKIRLFINNLSYTFVWNAYKCMRVSICGLFMYCIWKSSCELLYCIQHLPTLTIHTTHTYKIAYLSIVFN